MARQQQIKIFIVSSLFFATLQNVFSQTRKIEVSINDTVKSSNEVVSIKKLSMKIDSTKVIDLIYYPNGMIRNILIKKGESEYQKIGFNYVGILISTGQYILIQDTILANGLYYHYSEDGILSHIYTYKNGNLDGEYKSYYPNGILEETGNYINGEKKGKWIKYTSKGIVLKVEIIK